jgi:hypothetical protein
MANYELGQYFADGGAIVRFREPSEEKHMSKDYNPNLTAFSNLDRLPEHDKGTMTQRVISGEKGMVVWSRIKAGEKFIEDFYPARGVIRPRKPKQ